MADSCAVVLKALRCNARNGTETRLRRRPSCAVVPNRKETGPEGTRTRAVGTLDRAQPPASRVKREYKT